MDMQSFYPGLPPGVKGVSKIFNCYIIYWHLKNSEYYTTTVLDIAFRIYCEETQVRQTLIVPHSTPMFIYAPLLSDKRCISVTKEMLYNSQG